jgi:hypothetical protein
VLRINPPLCISLEDATYLEATFEDALSSL